MSTATILAPEQQRVLDQLSAMGGKPIESLTAAEARKQPGPTDAVHAVLTQDGKPIRPEEVGTVRDQTIVVDGARIPIRVYTPSGMGPFPVIVYYHGGGFVIATNDTYDASARALTMAVGAVVVAVEYRKGPEHKFPAAHDDAFAAYVWVSKHTDELRGDPARVALAGESAGGNLAVSTAIMARERGEAMPVALLAVYPIAGTDTHTVSYHEQANAKPLNGAMMSWFFTQYLRTPADAQDARLNIVDANLSGLPPTTIIAAESDPLRTEGETLTSKLRAAGVSVGYRLFEGTAHEFFGQGAVQPVAMEAVAFAASALKNALSK